MVGNEVEEIELVHGGDLTVAFERHVKVLVKVMVCRSPCLRRKTTCHRPHMHRIAAEAWDCPRSICAPKSPRSGPREQSSWLAAPREAFENRRWRRRYGFGGSWSNREASSPRLGSNASATGGRLDQRWEKRVHRWAMDRYLIAPGPDRVWHVMSSLDDWLGGLCDLLQRRGRSILLPHYPPKDSALRLATVSLALCLPSAHRANRCSSYSRCAGPRKRRPPRIDRAMSEAGASTQKTFFRNLVPPVLGGKIRLSSL